MHRRITLLVFALVIKQVVIAQAVLWVDEIEIARFDPQTKDFGKFEAYHVQDGLRLVLTSTTLMVGGTGTVYTLKEQIVNKETATEIEITRWAVNQDGERCIISYFGDRPRDVVYLMVSRADRIVRYKVGKITKL
ncbi:hypothetical protein [Paracnuella aquatica]|uniref:hypothetical protein n=1 Tax=Paracnuella aquatica TaxID=2268757 RepID=UPI000DEEF46E|nr:hypothetical protein [Paracnuella aquatica]RPD51422.1 hypothetical protein DRJ53_01690 [Paracnuella aquatica]